MVAGFPKNCSQILIVNTHNNNVRYGQEIMVLDKILGNKLNNVVTYIFNFSFWVADIYISYRKNLGVVIKIPNKIYYNCRTKTNTSK